MGVRGLHKIIHTALALGYLLLGVAAVWHAPHFSQAHASVSVDRHAEHEAVLGGECALCAVKTAPQLSAARVVHVLAAPVAGALAASPDAFAGANRFFAGRPRAPPFLS